MIRFEQATIEHAEAMAPRVRANDVREVAALGMSAAEALRHSVEASLLAEAAVVGEEVGAMWGVCPWSLVGTKGLMWMLGTEHVARHPKVLLRVSRAFVQKAHAIYPQLECLVDLRYHQAVRWVRWMGFAQERRLTLGEAPFGVFHREV